jgi:hypothetical protein
MSYLLHKHLHKKNIFNIKIPINFGLIKPTFASLFHFIQHKMRRVQFKKIKYLHLNFKIV